MGKDARTSMSSAPDEPKKVWGTLPIGNKITDSTRLSSNPHFV
ncbi:hypothetical protein [Photorhabdus antumapuensis]|nr:hypothetical protein [Photorhabdus antumapuensis]